MIPFPLPLLIAGFLTLCGTTTASPSAAGSQHPLADRLATLTILEEYDAALVLVDSLLAREPRHPFGWLMRAAVLATRSIDFEDQLDMTALITACEKTKALCQTTNPQGFSQAEGDLYAGMAEMLLVMIDHREGRYITAVKRLINAGKSLKRAVEADSELWDAYYGLGMYQYYVSANAGIIRSLGLVADKRDVGLRNIRLAAEKGVITRNAARNGLAWISLNNGDYETAIREAQALLKQYPERRAFLWLLGKAYLKSKRYQEAAATLERLRIAISRQKRNNHYNDVSCLKMLAEAHFQQGGWRDVILCADEAAQYQLTDWVYRKKKGDLQVLKELKAKALKKMNED